MIYFTIGVSFIFELVVIGILLTLRDIAHAIVWSFVFLLHLYIMWRWQSRIPFAKILLKTVAKVSRQFPATFFTAFIGLIVQMLYSVTWILTVAGLVFIRVTNKISQPAFYTMLVYLVIFIPRPTHYSYFTCIGGPRLLETPCMSLSLVYGPLN